MLQQNNQRHYLLLLGGNIGDVRNTFEQAAGELEKIGTIIAQSGFYCSKSWGFESADLFLNQVIEITTNKEPQAMLVATQSIEKRLGRTTKSVGGQYQSRIIDIDILFCDNLILNTQELTIPHPLLHKRRFTLQPLTEKWSNLVHPVLHKTIDELLAECPDEGKCWLG